MPAFPSELNAMSKLTAAAVKEIRDSYEPGRISYAQLAERYGVSRQLVHRIVRRELWQGAESVEGARGVGRGISEGPIRVGVDAYVHALTLKDVLPPRLKHAALAFASMANGEMGRGVDVDVKRLTLLMGYSPNKEGKPLPLIHASSLIELGWIDRSSWSYGRTRGSYGDYGPATYQLTLPHEVLAVVGVEAEKAIANGHCACDQKLGLHELQRKADAYDTLVAIGIVTDDKES